MPTYEYVCDACGHKFDEFQSMSDKPLKKCPECKKQKLRRLFGCGAAILFKGGGFYETDYRSDSYKASAQADQQSASATPASDSGSKDSGSKESSAPAASKPAASSSDKKSSGSKSKSKD